tara:strand:- start:5030 stop:5293 length:264 start_codon:yes stop_codon:yes gene_type:complete
MDSFAYPENDILQLAIECIKTKEEIICQDSLNEVEKLQRYAAFKKNFPCQTSLIGLSSDLIRAQLSYSSDISNLLITRSRALCVDIL